MGSSRSKAFGQNVFPSGIQPPFFVMFARKVSYLFFFFFWSIDEQCLLLAFLILIYVFRKTNKRILGRKFKQNSFSKYPLKCEELKNPPISDACVQPNCEVFPVSFSFYIINVPPQQKNKKEENSWYKKTKYLFFKFIFDYFIIKY